MPCAIVASHMPVQGKHLHLNQVSIFFHRLIPATFHSSHNPSPRLLCLTPTSPMPSPRTCPSRRVLHTNTLSSEQLQEVLQSSAQPQATTDDKDDDLALRRPNVTAISKGLTLEYCQRACRSTVESLGGEITYIPGGISEDESRRAVDSCFSVSMELPLVTTRV